MLVMKSTKGMLIWKQVKKTEYEEPGVLYFVD